jgi:hypothetical protein
MSARADIAADPADKTSEQLDKASGRLDNPSDTSNQRSGPHDIELHPRGQGLRTVRQALPASAGVPPGRGPVLIIAGVERPVCILRDAA